MELEEKKRLTRDWICIMLYAGPRTMDFFVNEGCRVMVYGWSFEELESILQEMVNDGTITQHAPNYFLPLKGKFNVKKSTIVPLLNLTDNPEYVAKFVEKNKENCDYQFIQQVSGTNTTQSKEALIVSYAKENYDKLATMVSLVIQFMSGIHS